MICAKPWRRASHSGQFACWKSPEARAVIGRMRRVEGHGSPPATGVRRIHVRWNLKLCHAYVERIPAAERRQSLSPRREPGVKDHNRTKSAVGTTDPELI